MKSGARWQAHERLAGTRIEYSEGLSDPRLERNRAMTILLYILAGLAGLGGLACSIFIIVEMFRDEIWKGVLGILCSLYFLYYGLFDWEHDWKWPIFLGAIGGNGIAAGLLSLAQGG